MARLSGEQKRLIQRGADLRGQTPTEFVIAAAQDAATRAIVDREVIELSLRDSRAFAEGLLDPPLVGAPLRAAAKRYRKATGCRWRRRSRRAWSRSAPATIAPGLPAATRCSTAIFRRRSRRTPAGVSLRPSS